MATNVPTTFISVGNNVKDGDLSGFLDIINFLLGETAPPQVLTTSFGADETDISPALAQYEQAAMSWACSHCVPNRTLCNAYAALGARGTSILFA